MSKKDTPDDKPKQETNVDNPAKLIGNLGYKPPPPPKNISRIKIIDTGETLLADGEILKGYVPPPPPQSKKPEAKTQPTPNPPQTEEQPSQPPPEKD